MNGDRELKRMSLETKVGQLFTFYHSGLAYAEFADAMIVKYQAGGMFLDMDSLDHPEQVHALTAAMQQASLRRGSGIPLFISADFVAGAGCKLPGGGATHFPKNRALGAAGDAGLAYESGRITAIESLAMGVNFNYSPVVDINNNPLNPVIGTHSFGEEPELVSELGCAVIRGLQDHGMIATAKHFPGHGDTHVDSHLALPVLEFDRERLESFELRPFRRAIEAGADAVMVGHIAVPALDDRMLPASLSDRMIQGLLRERMGFDGLVVTDGLSMKGITSAFTQAEACVMAIEAGADVLLAHARTAEEAGPMVEAVLEAVRSGAISEARIDESVRRVLKAKAKYGIVAERVLRQAFAADALNRADAYQVSLDIASKALVASDGLRELLDRGDRVPERWHLLRDGKTARFAGLLRGEGLLAGETVLGSHEELPDHLAGSAGGRDLLVALSHNKRLDAALLRGLNEYARSGGKVALALFGSGYDLEHLPDVPTLVLHDGAPSLQEAAYRYFANATIKGGSHG